MAKRIGIIGGISSEATKKYYDLLLKKYFERKKNFYYPEIVIFSLDLQKFSDLEGGENRADYVKYIIEGAQALENAGAECILISANSAHAVYDEVSANVGVPMMSIIEETAKVARSKNMKKLLLLGIHTTMKAAFYPRIFSSYGMEIVLPVEEEQEEVNRIIWDELVLGIINPESKEKLLDIISKYEKDGVILGSTELPIILKQSDTDVPVLDTVDIHTNAALEFSLNEEN